MNFFYLDKSIILVQRILILSIFICSALFSSCALEEPEKESKSTTSNPSVSENEDTENGGSSTSLSATILQELETNLSSTNSGRSHQISSSAKTADTGKTPPESAFPKTNISGLASS